MRRAARAVLAVKTVIAQKGGPSSDMLVVDLHEMVDGNASAKSPLSWGFAEVGHGNSFK